jgi:MFS family permease
LLKGYQFLISVFASLGSALYGYDLGVIAGAVNSKNFGRVFSPTPNETGAVVSVFTGGAFFGAAFAGPLADWVGRKKTILVGSLIFILGGGLQAGAQALSTCIASPMSWTFANPSLGYLYAGRAIAGIGVGALVMIIPPYQAELCHPDIRGRVTALQQFMLGVGALVAVSIPSFIPESWE